MGAIWVQDPPKQASVHKHPGMVCKTRSEGRFRNVPGENNKFVIRQFCNSKEAWSLSAFCQARDKYGSSKTRPIEAPVGVNGEPSVDTCLVRRP